MPTKRFLLSLAVLAAAAASLPFGLALAEDSQTASPTSEPGGSAPVSQTPVYTAPAEAGEPNGPQLEITTIDCDELPISAEQRQELRGCASVGVLDEDPSSEVPPTADQSLEAQAEECKAMGDGAIQNPYCADAVEAFEGDGD